MSEKKFFRRAEKPYKGIALEGPLANWYAKTTLKDIKRHQEVAQQLSKVVTTDSRFLEIACGPGYLCVELAKLKKIDITGIDISESFISISRNVAAEALVDVKFMIGNASELPFGDNCFNFTFCQAAFKNITSPVKAINEMYRVLEKGGIAIIYDLRKDASPGAVHEYIKNMGLSQVNSIITKWTFKQMIMRSAYTVHEMESFISESDFKKSKIEAGPDELGFRIWLEK
jgi:ubiquinone/menaquinone biosynthesis C-methylase UbiE